MRNNVNMTVNTPGSSLPGHMGIDLSRGNLQTQQQLSPEIEYDPWQANQQRF